MCYIILTVFLIFWAVVFYCLYVNGFFSNYDEKTINKLEQGICPRCGADLMNKDNLMSFVDFNYKCPECGAEYNVEWEY